MAKQETPKYAHWNGKNLEGQSYVGDKDLLSEGLQSGTGSKYEVSDETKAITSQDLE